MPPCCQRSVRVGDTDGTPIGPMPSTRVGVNGLGAPSTSTAVAGTVVVTVITNSAVTTYGRAAPPSGGSGAGPPDVCGGTAPALTIEERALATPAAASSRYLGTNSPTVSRGVDWSSSAPNGTDTVHGPTSILARPWNSGPSTVSSAPHEIEKVMSPNQVSIVMPAAIRT